RFVLFLPLSYYFFFFFTASPPTEIYTLSLHDALPISVPARRRLPGPAAGPGHGAAGRPAGRRLPGHPGGGRARPAEPQGVRVQRSEEHTSELQSRGHLVCRLLLEKKKIKQSKRRRS